MADEKPQTLSIDDKTYPSNHNTSTEFDSENLSIDHAAEARLIRKLDLHIIPMVMALYLFSFLDRVNIGNARLYGMEKDLGLKGTQYQTAVSLLFVTYIITELPSNLVVKKLRPSRWIAFLTVSWGLIATLTGLAQNYAGLIACRLLLGAAEGGLFPGVTIYLTLFYSKRELGLRVGYLFVSAALAGACGGLLAYLIGFMDGTQGLRGWRWIMILEGIPTFLIGIVTWFVLADDPENAYFLTPEEKLLMTVRREREIGHTKRAMGFHKDDMWKALMDWKVWIFAFGQFGVDTMLYGYSTFLPTIIKGLGHWTTAEVQALTIPCYALGAITYLVSAYISDKTQRRGIFVVVFGTISVIGYAVLISDSPKGVHYLGCFLVAMGLYTCVGIPLSWLPLNQPRYGKRTTATGMQLSIGNMAGIMAPFLYKTDEAPRFVRGHAVTLGLVAFTVLLFGFMSFHFSQKNRRRARGEEDWKREGRSEEEVTEMGDESPGFVFTR